DRNRCAAALDGRRASGRPLYLASIPGNPGFVVIVAGVLALAIGGNTGIFSIARAALAPLPIPDADRVTMVWTENPARDWHQFPASMPDVRDWHASGVFAALGVFANEGFNLRLPDRTERVE